MNMGGLNKNKERIQARKSCAVCGHKFKSNEFKSMIYDRFYCERCSDME